jgi:modulator of FtsH protease
VVPADFISFFIASSGAAAALAGLLFVAVSLAPEQNVTRRAPLERQAMAGSAFTALINAFFTSMGALIPHFNFGIIIVPVSCVSLLTSLAQAWSLLRMNKGWSSFLRRTFLVLLSMGLYAIELRQGIGLITDPTQVAFVYGMLFLLLGIFALGLTRAWELLGAQRYGFAGWLNPLRDVDEELSLSPAADTQLPSNGPSSNDGAPRSPNQ